MMAVHGALAALLDPAQAAGQDLLARFDLDGEELYLQVRGGQVVCELNDDPPDLVFTGSASALFDVCRGAGGFEDVASRLTVKGSAAARSTFARMFSLDAVPSTWRAAALASGEVATSVG